MLTQRSSAAVRSTVPWSAAIDELARREVHGWARVSRNAVRIWGPQPWPKGAAPAAQIKIPAIYTLTTEPTANGKETIWRLEAEFNLSQLGRERSAEVESQLQSFVDGEALATVKTMEWARANGLTF